MKHTTLIIAILIILFGCGQKVQYPYKITDFRPELQKNLIRINSFDDNPNLFLVDSCTDSEIVELLECEKPTIRYNAYFALLKRRSDNLYNVLLKHLDDTAKVEIRGFDFQYELYISDIMLQVASNRLTRSQKDTLFDKILRNHRYLGSLQWMIRQVPPQEKYHSIIKSQANIKSDDCLQYSFIFALSKLRKQEDIPFIKKTLLRFINSDGSCNEYTFKSIEIFPDSAFFPILSKFYNKTILKYENYNQDIDYYCRAIAVYRNQESLELLKSLTKKRPNLDSNYYQGYLEYVFKAIHKNNSPIYTDLYKELRNKMPPDVMKNINKPDYNFEPRW